MRFWRVHHLTNNQVGLVRQLFIMPSGITDEDIEKILQEAQVLITDKIHVVAGNIIEQREMAEKALQAAGKSCSDITIGDWEARGRDLTELLFRWGFYGASCVWARALVEYMLQDDVIQNAGKSPELAGFKQKIESPGWNPGIDEMFRALVKAGIWSNADSPDFDLIKNHGDWVVHHRYDMTTKGEMASRYKFGFARVTFGVEGVKVVDNEDRKTLEFNRDNEERRLAKESLKSLYDLIVRRRSK